jgi:hypothetical protein
MHQPVPEGTRRNRLMELEATTIGFLNNPDSSLKA